MKRILTLVLALCCLLPTAQGRKVYLVAAGVSDYPGTANDLTLPSMDARAISKLYRTNSSAEILLLTDENATMSNIKNAIRQLFGKANKDDIVVFFFSGHGFPGGFVAYDGRLKYDSIRSLFSDCDSQNKMIFADACFSGDMRGKESIDDSEKAKLNLMLLLSSRDDEVSYENSRYKNGFFTICLERCLRGGADFDCNRIITAKELYQGVRKGVVELSDDRQHPVMWGNFNDNMPVMVW